MMGRRSVLTFLGAAFAALGFKETQAIPQPAARSPAFAVRGETVTCTNGHEICDVAQDLTAEMTLRVNQFDNWRIKKPESGDGISVCPICGADYLRRENQRLRLHIAGGWRDPRTGTVSL